MNLNAVKRKTAVAFDALGINSLGLFLQRAFLSPFIRVVNYHDIPADQAANFENHLRYYSKRFVNVGEDQLRRFLAGEKWKHDHPGLIISLDDGLRSHCETAAPLLEKFGFTGWFFVPSGRVRNVTLQTNENPDLDDSLTVDQLRSLANGHVIGSHTVTHCRLSKDVSPDQLTNEVEVSRTSLTEMLGREIDIFCWVGGEEFTYSKTASDLIRRNYELGFMTNNSVVRASTDPLQLQRTNIESDNPLSLVRFQLSGLMDLLYFPKRRRVNHLTR